MTRLKELVLQQNQLFGFECLEEYENCEFDMPNLQRLDLSGLFACIFSYLSISSYNFWSVADNQFEGTVPMQIFHLPALRSVALVNGCFHGELNSDICMASNLEVFYKFCICILIFIS